MNNVCFAKVGGSGGICPASLTATPRLHPGEVPRATETGGDGRGYSYTVFMFPIELAKKRYIRLEESRHRYIEETYVKELFGAKESEKNICVN